MWAAEHRISHFTTEPTSWYLLYSIWCILNKPLKIDHEHIKYFNFDLKKANLRVQSNEDKTASQFVNTLVRKAWWWHQWVGGTTRAVPKSMRQNHTASVARVSRISRRWVSSCTHDIMSVRFLDTTRSSFGHYRMASVWNCFQSWTELHVILWPTVSYFKTFTVSIETCFSL